MAISGIVLMKGAEIEDIKTAVIARDSANYRVHLDVTVTYRGFTTVEELDTIARLKTNVCGKCSKIAGNYYEATLQLLPATASSTRTSWRGNPSTGSPRWSRTSWCGVP